MMDASITDRTEDRFFALAWCFLFYSLLTIMFHRTAEKCGASANNSYLSDPLTSGDILNK